MGGSWFAPIELVLYGWSVVCPIKLVLYGWSMVCPHRVGTLWVGFLYVM